EDLKTVSGDYEPPRSLAEHAADLAFKGVKDEPTTEPGAEGKPQTVIPGAEKITPGEQAQRKADESLKPKAPQKDTDGLALFNDSAKQGDLLDAKPKAEKKPSN